jgi:hypothetical protein
MTAQVDAVGTRVISISLRFKETEPSASTLESAALLFHSR